MSDFREDCNDGQPLSSRRQLLAVGLALWIPGTRAASLEGQTAAPTLRFTRIGQGPELARIESALREAYGRIGRDVEFVDMPGERAIVESNAGRTDGETARIAGMETTYEELRRVEVPLYLNTNSIFVFGGNKAVPSSLNALSQLERVGIVRGWKASEEATAGWRNVVNVTSYASALQMLKLGRMDAFLGRSEDTLRALQREGLSLSDFPNRVVLRFPLFHYLHRRHEALLPAVTQELRRLQGKRAAVVDSWMP